MDQIDPTLSLTRVGHEEGISAAFLLTQGSGTTVTYELYGTNDCGQTLFTDQELFVVRNIPFEGDGMAPSLAGISEAQQESNREE